MRESILQLHGCLFKVYDLLTCESIELRCVTAYKMREDGTWDNRILPLQAFNQTGHVFGSESQTMHTGIHLDMNGEVGNPLFLRFLNQGFQQVETIDFGFQLVVKHRLECRHFRIHDDDACRNPGLAEFGTFISHSYSQIIHVMLLQSLGNFV